MKGKGAGYGGTFSGGKSIFHEPRAKTKAKAKAKAKAKRRAASSAGYGGTFSGGKSIFHEPRMAKSSARSAAAKARAPAKGSPEAMAIGARLRAAKAAKRNQRMAAQGMFY